MLENKELIDFTLAQAGEYLYFSYFSIKAIPGHLVYNVQSYDSLYDMEKQDFDFQISHCDFLCYEITTDTIFKYRLNAREYTFKVLAAIEDLIGWVQLKTEFISSDSL